MLLVSGFALALLILIARKFTWKWRVVSLLAGIVVGPLAAGLLDGLGLLPKGSPRGDGWWNAKPWKELILLAALVSGMMLRVVWDAVEVYRARKSARNSTPPTGPVFDRWDFVSPLLVSLLVFQSVLSFAEHQDLSWQLVLFSLQNGFFWNYIFNKVKTGSLREFRARR